LFIPAFISPFKQQRDEQDIHASANDRMAMCWLAVDLLNGDALEKKTCAVNSKGCTFDVSDWELRRGGVSYTVDTLTELRKEISAAQAMCENETAPDIDVFFILGTDAALDLPRWQDAEKLQQLATFAIVEREGVEWNPREMLSLQQAGFCVLLVEGPQNNVFSRDIRQQLRDGKDVSCFLPLSVAAYVQMYKPYASDLLPNGSSAQAKAYVPDARAAANWIDDEAACDLPDLPDVETLKSMLQERVNAHRLWHIMGVAETARELALVYGVDPEKAYLAGLLHDWDKCYNDDEIRARAINLGLSIDQEVLDNMPQTLHGITAAAFFKQNYRIDKAIVQAIERHTTGHISMDPLDMVVYIADGLEPGRHFDRLDELRAMIGEISLEDLFVEIYGYWITLILVRKKTMHPDTMIVWNTYAKRYASRHNLKFDRRAKSL